MNIETFRNTIYWKTLKGEKILIKDLTDEHIKNIIKRNAPHNETIIPLLKEEIFYRLNKDDEFLKMFKRNSSYIYTVQGTVFYQHFYIAESLI